MGVSETYYLAHTARAKLSREAARADFNLRQLVGHANLLDYLMLELADAEREQEKRYNQSVHHSAPAASSEEQKHIRWAIPSIEESDEEEEEYASSSSDSDSDDDESDYLHDDSFFVNVTPAFTTRSTSSAPARSFSSMPLPIAQFREIEDVDDEDHYSDDLEEDYADLALTRTNSHSQHPPELLSDEESSDEELSPPSPPQLSFDHFSASEEREEVLVHSQFYSKSPSASTPKLSPAQPVPSLIEQPLFIRPRR